MVSQISITALGTHEEPKMKRNYVFTKTFRLLQ